MKKTFLALCLALALILSCAGAQTSPDRSVYDALYPELSAAHQALDGVLSAQPGTAGASLKAAIAACGLLDWSMEPSDEEAYSLPEAILGWWLGLSGEEQTLFLESIEPVLAQADEIAADFGAAKDLLENAGNPQRHDGYDPESWQALRGELERFVTWLNTRNETTNDTKGVYGE